MHPSVRVLAHKPLISFVGKRVWPATAGPSHPHPAAPPEWQKSFSEKADPSQATQDHPVFLEFWEAPARFSKPYSRYLEQAEIDAILSGGASLR
ncbi:hypothetical protein DEU56DRAFT_800117 [Suillus clintonianus]|uniref:uncharacterized protein n=1 Tax=Suillus clintonianus TaxID=1904413 RepID=UPI001B8791F2|nr:uncharacterized protein DEU56DRAFT_800117 [Suillus clintonianus]KAG2139762.1 hypothetical protein DEU56DRAFT_800117 [Suillus clintonianus]